MNWLLVQYAYRRWQHSSFTHMAWVFSRLLILAPRESTSESRKISARGCVFLLFFRRRMCILQRSSCRYYVWAFRSAKSSEDLDNYSWRHKVGCGSRK